MEAVTVQRGTIPTASRAFGRIDHVSKYHRIQIRPQLSNGRQNYPDDTTTKAYGKLR